MITTGPKQVLDIACGNGGHAIALSKEGYIVTALDSDPEMIESAKVKADLEEVSVGLIELSKDAGFKVVGCYGDFGKSPFNEDESYHCIAVLEV